MSTISNFIEEEIANRVNAELEKRKEELNAHHLLHQKEITKLHESNIKIEKEIDDKLLCLDKKSLEIQNETKEQQQHWLESNNKLEARATAIANSVRDCSEDKRVSLNIGGTVFETLQSTISRISPFFACLFSDVWRDTGNKTIRDEAGNIFIDRSPMHFDHLLNWSRNGCDPEELRQIFKVAASDSSSCQNYLKTFEYYGIEIGRAHV